MENSLSFITNENNQTLLERFKTLIKDTHLFDCLVGYFYTSGFYRLYPALEQTEKIRILIGMSTNKETFDLIQQSTSAQTVPNIFSHAEIKQQYAEAVKNEYEQSEDSSRVEEGTLKFREWIINKKLEIRAYPAQNIHAKLYIMTFKKGDRDEGRVITGSSNFTQSGLEDNLEFNVELKHPSDYRFAIQKFEELWQEAVDVSEKFIQTIEEETWINPNIEPYELYLKFLYEYFKDELSQSEEVLLKYIPQEFKKLEYQEQAVLNAKKILEEYGGVFISDVVGLGKTYIAAMLASQLDGRTLVIAPPVLLEKSNPGSWPNVFSDFHVAADYESVGRLDDLRKRDIDKYKNIIIDEAHRFRNESTLSYELLAEICRGKRVILVTATPYNNSPMDILSQIKLFQNPRRSTIPNLPNLENFFRQLENKLKNFDKQKDYEKYIKTVKENAKEIREKVLKHLMVRRTRTEIVKYFSEDMKKQGLKFPEVNDPKPLYYQLNEKEDSIFNETIKLISQQLTYARYTPLLPKYYKKSIQPLEEQSQINMGRFMKVLLVKRLESSFHAFRKSIDRFIHSYEIFIDAYKEGSVYFSKKYANKIFEFLENDDDESIQRLLDENKADCYDAADFSEAFLTDLTNDLKQLKKLQSLWSQITRDPKLLAFLDKLSKDKILNTNKLIIFTESKETAEYLTEEINKKFGNTGKFTYPALCYTGSSRESVRDKVVENFDAKVKNPKDDYRILITTEVLSEGVNLHRANVVINYDIPWNPTRMMQRVGRINRVDTNFDKIYTFNFFPTTQADNEIKLKEIAEAKIHAFFTLLGGDAALLTDGEPIGSHELFNRLISKKTLTGEDEAEESELKYLKVIKDIRDNERDLFEKIKRLPKKARTAKESPQEKGALLTYFKLGKLHKFYLSSPNNDTRELDFISAAELLESSPNEKKEQLPKDFFELLDKNKEAFRMATTQETAEYSQRRGRDKTYQILRIIKATLHQSQQLTDEQEEYLKQLAEQLEAGAIPKQTANKAFHALQQLQQELIHPLKVVAALQAHIPLRFLQAHYVGQNLNLTAKREVILSMYLKGE
ncbi:helicase-related protein [Thermoflavifilum thermophilum]|uniref:SNF2 family N-terminal domain-containing protein n=1 Tax=Thermoflavifilum thermophilum TaxID=1393122 RepID=A0A1I7NGY1_9BACT|nr:helicase-related protein [Thermoflavifilum thermophilum]SFV33883.1 SNF2 family N-terminal domain-containing protein [Thermoflavifilum thermophilum]